MDRWLFAAFVSSLAGLFTAILSVVKLVNEKENKTSSYRQEWTTSVRSVFADFSSTLLALTILFEEQERYSDILNESKTKNRPEQEKKEIYELLEKTRDQIITKRNDLYKSYALTKLHFKPNDPSFNLVEQKYDILDHMIRDMIEANGHDKRIELKGEIKRHITELINLCRDILKTEWETIKRGEHAYKITKKYAMWGGIVAMFFVISIGIHAYISIHKNSTSEAEQNTPTNSLSTQNKPRKTVDQENVETTKNGSCHELSINQTVNQHFESTIADSKKGTSSTISKKPDCPPHQKEQ